MTIRGFRQGRMAHLLAVVPAALLAAGTPAAWAGPATSAKPSTALEVQSEPAGAAVYVDGQLKGETPVAVEGILSGDHRIRVVKDGFLENSRTVSVPASGRSLRVALTPTRTPARAMMQVEPGEPAAESGGGGGGKKWIYIGAGAALLAGGTVAAVLLLGGNDPPKVSSVTASPSVALQSATQVSFSASATDKDGDSLTYSWDFGDGQTGSGASTTHSYQSTGSFGVSVEVSDGKKKATGSTNVTVRSLAGSWSGRITGGFSYTCNFAQSGAAVSGTCADGSRTWTTVGSVVAPLGVNLTASRPGYQPWYMRGNASSDLNSITGTTSGLVSGGVPVTPGFVLSR